MTLDPLVAAIVGIAVVVALVAVTQVPAVRHVARTAFDMVDGSLGMYMIRDLLGRSTTTSRERRIARRRAHEQAEIERRIGAVGGAAPSPVPVSTPTRLVVSGEAASSTVATPRGRSMPRPSAPHGRLVRDAFAVLAIGAIVLTTVAVVRREPAGDVLAATGSPDTTEAPGSPGAAVASASPGEPVASASPASVARPSTGASVSRPSTGPSAGPATGPLVVPSVVPTGGGGDGGGGGGASASPSAGGSIEPETTGLGYRIVGRSDGGRSVAVELRWTTPDPRAGGSSVEGFDVVASVDGGDLETVASVDADVTSVRQRLTLGRTYEFGVRARGLAGAAGPTASWPALTPARHQETTSLATYSGAWRAAAGRSLSGDTVTFTRSVGARAVVGFTGRDIAWIATRTPMSGRAEVFIDGELVTTVDLAAPTVQYRRIVFRHTFEDRGRHRLEIRALGDGRVDVDAFIVLR